MVQAMQATIVRMCVVSWNVCGIGRLLTALKTLSLVIRYVHSASNENDNGIHEAIHEIGEGMVPFRAKIVQAKSYDNQNHSKQRHKQNEEKVQDKAQEAHEFRACGSETDSLHCRALLGNESWRLGLKAPVRSRLQIAQW